MNQVKKQIKALNKIKAKHETMKRKQARKEKGHFTDAQQVKLMTDKEIMEFYNTECY